MRCRRYAMPLARAVDDFAEPTLTASVFNRLRSDIVGCRLMPNERLRVEALRERYGAGGSPVREALMRLQAEGLVELEQHKGFRVSAVSRERLLDLMQARIEIEGLALRWSIERGAVEWEADLLGAFHRLSCRHKTASPGGAIDADWSREHRAFHAALVAACGSPTILAIRENLFDRTARYVALAIVSKSTPRNDAAEHEQIMRAALTRDAKRALALTREHIERTMNRVMRSLGESNAATRPRRTNGKGAR